MMQELGVAATASSIGGHYGDLLDGYVVDHADAGSVACPGVEIMGAATMMATLTDRESLAREVLRFADRLRRSRAESAGASA
jgi:LPPG:FO 2-phospho-L-lactate transferase